MDGRTKIETFILDLEESMHYDKEEWLEAMVQASGLSYEEFDRDYKIIEYPIEIERVGDIFGDSYRFTVKQNFHLKKKTDDEKLRALESKEKKDDSSKPE